MADRSRTGSTAARATVGVRARVLAAVLLFAALAMAVSGTAVLLVQQSRAVEKVDSGIAADVGQFRALAAGRLGPTAAASFTDVRSLLVVAVQRQVPADDETFLALINGRPWLVPSGPRPVLLDQEAASCRASPD